MSIGLRKECRCSARIAPAMREYAENLLSLPKFSPHAANPVASRQDQPSRVNLARAMTHLSAVRFD